MDFSLIPRRAARLSYETARLPLAILDKRVVAPLWDDQALPRVGLELFLGLVDSAAGWLLADDRISRRGQALTRRTESPAVPGERESTPQARRSQLEEDARAAQEAARQARQQAHERINVSHQQDQEDGQQAHRLVKYLPEEAGHPGSP